jgi:hypothetical protein
LVKAFYPSADFSALPLAHLEGVQGGGFLVTSKQGSMELDSAQTARLILGPHLEQARLEEGKSPGGRQLTVPVPLWIWGLDAV